jgi:hypothetical protein
VLDEFTYQQGGEILDFWPPNKGERFCAFQTSAPIKGERIWCFQFFSLDSLQGEIFALGEALILLSSLRGRVLWQGEKYEPFGAFDSCVEPFACF